MHFNGVSASDKCFESLSRRLQSQPRFRGRGIAVTESWAIVPNQQMEGVLIVTGGDPNLSSRGELSNAMPQCVLHERLQNQMRHLRVQRVGRDIKNNVEPVLEPDLLDFEVD